MQPVSQVGRTRLDTIRIALAESSAQMSDETKMSTTQISGRGTSESLAAAARVRLFESPY